MSSPCSVPGSLPALSCRWWWGQQRCRSQQTAQHHQATGSMAKAVTRDGSAWCVQAKVGHTGKQDLLQLAHNPAVCLQLARGAQGACRQAGRGCRICSRWLTRDWNACLNNVNNCKGMTESQLSGPSGPHYCTSTQCSDCTSLQLFIHAQHTMEQRPRLLETALTWSQLSNNLQSYQLLPTAARLHAAVWAVQVVVITWWLTRLLWPMPVLLTTSLVGTMKTCLARAAMIFVSASLLMTLLPRLSN